MLAHLGHPSNPTNPSFGSHFNTLIYSHPFDAEVLAQRLIGTCTKLYSLKNTSHLPEDMKKVWTLVDVVDAQ